MSGITTNILAHKLQTHALEQGHADTVVASRIGMHAEILPQMDMVFIAPQARFSSETLKKDAAGLGIPVHELSEEDLVYSRVEEIYKVINANRNEDKAKVNVQRLGPSSYVRILVDSWIRCAPFLILGILSYLVHFVTRTDISNTVYHASMGVFNLYLMFALGYHYGLSIKSSPLSYGIMTMGFPLIMLPNHSIVNYQLNYISISDGFIALEYLGLKYTLIFMGYSLLTIIIVDQLNALKLKTNRQYNVVMRNLVEMPLKYGFIIMVFLLLQWTLGTFR